MHIVFMGTPEFAVPSLDILIKNGFRTGAVITATDKPAGRGLRIRESPVKQYASRHGLRILQPENLKDPGFNRELRAIGANLFVVVAFRMLPETVWSIPEYGTVNLHASLLPHYRGAAPINHAIMNGEKVTGLTTFFIDHEMDKGEVIMQEPVEIGDTETAGGLHDRMMIRGADLLLRTVQAISGGTFKRIPQSGINAGKSPPKKAPRLSHDACRIKWTRPAGDLYNFVRGLSPFPGAWTELHRKDGARIVFKIFFAETESCSLRDPPGTVLSGTDNRLRVITGKNCLIIKTLQQSGKKSLPAGEFLKGFSFRKEDRFV